MLNISEEIKMIQESGSEQERQRRWRQLQGRLREEDMRRKLRNIQLITGVERLGERAASLRQLTDKLRLIKRQYDVLSHLKESHPLSQSQRGVDGEPQLINQSQHVTLHATQSLSGGLESSQSQHDFVEEHELSGESQGMRPAVSPHESQSQLSFGDALSRGIVSGPSVGNGDAGPVRTDVFTGLQDPRLALRAWSGSQSALPAQAHPALLYAPADVPPGGPWGPHQPGRDELGRSVFQRATLLRNRIVSSVPGRPVSSPRDRRRSREGRGDAGDDGGRDVRREEAQDRSWRGREDRGAAAGDYDEDRRRPARDHRQDHSRDADYSHHRSATYDHRSAVGDEVPSAAYEHASAQGRDYDKRFFAYDQHSSAYDQRSSAYDQRPSAADDNAPSAAYDHSHPRGYDQSLPADDPRSASSVSRRQPASSAPMQDRSLSEFYPSERRRGRTTGPAEWDGTLQGVASRWGTLERTDEGGGSVHDDGAGEGRGYEESAAEGRRRVKEGRMGEIEELERALHRQKQLLVETAQWDAQGRHAREDDSRGAGPDQRRRSSRRGREPRPGRGDSLETDRRLPGPSEGDRAGYLGYREEEHRHRDGVYREEGLRHWDGGEETDRAYRQQGGRRLGSGAVYEEEGVRHRRDGGGLDGQDGGYEDQGDRGRWGDREVVSDSSRRRYRQEGCDDGEPRQGRHYADHGSRHDEEGGHRRDPSWRVEQSEPSHGDGMSGYADHRATNRANFGTPNRGRRQTHQSESEASEQPSKRDPTYSEATAAHGQAGTMQGRESLPQKRSQESTSRPNPAPRGTDGGKKAREGEERGRAAAVSEDRGGTGEREREFPRAAPQEVERTGWQAERGRPGEETGRVQRERAQEQTRQEARDAEQIRKDSVDDGATDRRRRRSSWLLSAGGGEDDVFPTPDNRADTRADTRTDTAADTRTDTAADSRTDRVLTEKRSGGADGVKSSPVKTAKEPVSVQKPADTGRRGLGNEAGATKKSGATKPLSVAEQIAQKRRKNDWLGERELSPPPPAASGKDSSTSAPRNVDTESEPQKAPGKRSSKKAARRRSASSSSETPPPAAAPPPVTSALPQPAPTKLRLDSGSESYHLSADLGGDDTDDDFWG